METRKCPLPLQLPSSPPPPVRRPLSRLGVIFTQKSCNSLIFFSFFFLFFLQGVDPIDFCQCGKSTHNNNSNHHLAATSGDDLDSSDNEILSSSEEEGSGEAIIKSIINSKGLTHLLRGHEFDENSYYAAQVQVEGETHLVVYGEPHLSKHHHHVRTNKQKNKQSVDDRSQTKIKGKKTRKSTLFVKKYFGKVKAIGCKRENRQFRFKVVKSLPKGLQLVPLSVPKRLEDFPPFEKAPKRRAVSSSPSKRK